MYDLFLAGLLLSIVHVGISFVAIHILKTDYKTYLALTVGSGLLLAFLLKLAASTWKSRINTVLSEEWHLGELPIDIVLFFVTLLLGGAASAILVYRRFGITGWVGAVAANSLASWII